MISNAQTPNWTWALDAGGTGQDACYAVAADANGNTYITGSAGSKITFGSYKFILQMPVIFILQNLILQGIVYG